MGGKDMVGLKSGFEFIVIRSCLPPVDVNHKNSSMCEATSYDMLWEGRPILRIDSRHPWY